jgi:hypothetical protein
MSAIDLSDFVTDDLAAGVDAEEDEAPAGGTRSLTPPPADAHLRENDEESAGAASPNGQANVGQKRTRPDDLTQLAESLATKYHLSEVNRTIVKNAAKVREKTKKVVT